MEAPGGARQEAGAGAPQQPPVDPSLLAAALPPVSTANGADAPSLQQQQQHKEQQQQVEQQQVEQQEQQQQQPSAADAAEPAASAGAATGDDVTTTAGGTSEPNGQVDVDSMELRGSAVLEAEVAAMLTDLPQAPMPPRPQGQGGDPALANVPVLPSFSRFKDAKKDLPLVCHVLGCGADLSVEADYYQRFRICMAHLKAPALAVEGIVQRFCQQCGRFQELREFDGDRRNCRARLQQHNSRRRKLAAMFQPVQQEPKRSRSAQQLSGKVQLWDLQAQYPALAGLALPLPTAQPGGFGLPQLQPAGLSLPLPALGMPGSAAHELKAFAAACAAAGGARPAGVPSGSGGSSYLSLESGSTGMLPPRDPLLQPHAASGSPAGPTSQPAWPPDAGPASLLLQRMAQLPPAGTDAQPPRPFPAGDHPEAQPLLPLFPQLAAQLVALSQRVQQLESAIAQPQAQPQAQPMQRVPVAAPQHGGGGPSPSPTVGSMQAAAWPPQPYQPPAPQQPQNVAVASLLSSLPGQAGLRGAQGVPQEQPVPAPAPVAAPAAPPASSSELLQALLQRSGQPGGAVPTPPAAAASQPAAAPAAGEDGGAALVQLTAFLRQFSGGAGGPPSPAAAPQAPAPQAPALQAGAPAAEASPAELLARLFARSAQRP